MVDAVPGPELRERYDAEHAGVPFLHFRAGDGRQVIVTLDEHVGHRTIGRGDDTDITLGWDAKVSRLHAELEHAGGWWTIVDDGLSRNGTFVNGDRLQGRRRLYDGDTVRVGDTALSFGAPSERGQGVTAAAADLPTLSGLSETQRRVLLALCRPYKERTGFSTPATNQQISEELFLSVDAVKTHLRVLFQKFEVEDLPQNQKRARLVELAFHLGLVNPRDL